MGFGTVGVEAAWQAGPDAQPEAWPIDGAPVAALGTVAFTLLILAAAGIAAVRVGLPPAIGYLLAGLIAASTIPGRLPVHEIEVMAELGVLALLFFIGIELDLKRLRRALRSTAWSIPFDIAVPGLMAASVVRLFGWGFNESLALGMAVSISSTLFGERLTATPGTERGARERVMGVLISEDVAAAGLIATIIVLAGGGGWTGPVVAIAELLFFLILLTAGALFIVPRILDEVARRHVPEVLALWAAGLAVLMGYLGYLADSAELGALVAGVAAAEAGSRYVVRNTLLGLRDLAAAVFFLSSGLAVQMSAILGVLAICVSIAAVFLVAKQMVHLPAGIISGLNLRGSMQSAVALSSLGEFSLILAAVAANNGVAHPDMQATIIGAMVILLPTAAVLNRSVPALERRFWRLPPRVRRPAMWIGRGVRTRGKDGEPGRWVAPTRMLVANVVVIAGWAALAAWLAPRIEPHLSGLPVPATALWFGVATGLAVPFIVGTFRAYRRLVWVLVGWREGEREGAGRVRARLVDAAVTLGFVLVLLAASLRFPQTLPVFLAGAAIAIIVAALAWQQLTRFHGAMEETMGRVLGHDQNSAALLDTVLERYPWGVKFVAVIVPPGSPVANQSLLDSRISELSGAMVAVLQRGRREMVSPASSEIIRPGDTLVLLGDAHQLARAEALVVSHGESIRMTAQTHSATVEELEISDRSLWAGKMLHETDIRRTTGTLVVGVWSGEGRHPVPYRPDLTIRPGDRLILLGTPLQIHRARLATEGIPEATEAG